MGKGSGSAPPPAPDYIGAARETAKGNMEALRYQTQANRVAQTNPWGTLNWTNNRTFDQAAYDRAVEAAKSKAAATPAGAAPTEAMFRVDYGEGSTGIDQAAYQAAMDEWKRKTADVVMPNKEDFFSDNWSQTVALNPELQAALDAQMSTQRQRSQLGESLMARVRDSYSQPFNAPDRASYMKNVWDVKQFDPTAEGVQQLDQNAPQYDPSRSSEYAKNAYEAQMALMRPDLNQREQRLSNSLALQGLSPGSAAANNALGSWYNSRSAQENALAGQAYMQGNDASRQDFGARLQGFNASNAARTQAFANALNKYSTNLGAQKQAYDQALTNYGTDYEKALQLRNMPLQEMNALLSGMGVQNPSFQNYALQGYSGGPDVLGATQATGNYNQSVWNAQQAADAQGDAATGQTIGTLATAAAMYF